MACTLPVMLAAFLSDTTGTLDGRPIFRFNGFGPRLPVSSVDTGQIIDADSARLQLYIVRRDTATHNLRLQFYRLPTTIDTTTTFDSLAGQFTDTVDGVSDARPDGYHLSTEAAYAVARDWLSPLALKALSAS